MITFTVYGTPKAQPRVKFSSRGKFGKAYTPDTANDWRALIILEAKRHFIAPLDGPIEVDATFIFPRPKAHFNSKGEIKPGAPAYHTSKPDRDNLDKCVLDTLTAIGAWRDDSQVCLGCIQKLYATPTLHPGAIIHVKQLTNPS